MFRKGREPINCRSISDPLNSARHERRRYSERFPSADPSGPRTGLYYWPYSSEAERLRGERWGCSIHLQPRVMTVLVALAHSVGQPVSRETLIDLCWATVTVGEDALNRCIQRLRRLAETEGKGAFTIETIPKVGYRLTVKETPSSHWRDKRSRNPHRPASPRLPYCPSPT